VLYMNTSPQLCQFADSYYYEDDATFVGSSIDGNLLIIEYNYKNKNIFFFWSFDADEFRNFIIDYHYENNPSIFDMMVTERMFDQYQILDEKDK